MDGKFYFEVKVEEGEVSFHKNPQVVYLEDYRKLEEALALYKKALYIACSTHCGLDEAIMAAAKEICRDGKIIR